MPAHPSRPRSVRRPFAAVAGGVLLGAVALLPSSASARQAVRSAVIVPAAPMISLQAASEPPPMSPEEVEQIRGMYDAMGPAEREELVATFQEMGVDLLALLGVGGDEAVPAGATPAAPPLLALVQQKDFKRTPKTVLAARTALGLERAERPAADADSAKLCEWLHRQVMAGEWTSFAWFVAERAGDDAEAIFAHVIQSTNQGDPMLLPEEVLAMADAAPVGPAEWQVDVLAQLLRTASARTSTGPMLDQLRAGTRHFGGSDPAARRRTAALLTQAGLPIEAYAYLPSLDVARAEGDALVMLGHALYHRGRMADARGPEIELERRAAFALLAEVVLLDRPDPAPEPTPADDEPVADPPPGGAPVPAGGEASGAAGTDDDEAIAAQDAARREALGLAMTMLPDIPESIASPWLRAVFQRDELAPAALEIIALDAMTLSDRKLDQAQRSRAILIMKTAVDSLLASERVDREVLRVPLRMLTTGLVTEAEKVADARPDPRRGNSRPGTAMLLRALPDQRWLDSIEPSLAVRAYRAFIAVATVADETDLALDILERGLQRHPGQARDLAGTFLGRWAQRMRPSSGSDQNAAMRAAFIMFGGQTSVSAAPLTRGRQARNLARLTRVLNLMDGIGADARVIPEVVEAFRACHSAAEAFTAEDIERVLGPIDALPGPTAATLAEAMRAGLSGDWRSRETQQRFGMRRNASEIAEVVADGYGVAMQLADRAVAEDPESWSSAVTRAALAFDRLEHRRAQRGDDFAEYETLRSQSFDAFANAAARYADLAAAGGIPVTIDVHLAWFNAAVGATQLDQLTRDNILYEGSERDTQIDRIRGSILAMRPDQSEAHMGAFVKSMTDALPGVNPEVKPRLVRHALRVVGDHPLGAPLRRISAVHEDLVQNEIALRLSLDGDPSIGARTPFGVVLSLRYTNAVDRETDGFSKYLRNQVWVYFGNQGRTLNYRDRLERSIERALEESFDVDSIAFFDPLFPSREVQEAGRTGWQEKPLAYLVLRAKDPSLERVPPVQMDLDFVDSTGPIILSLESNAPAVNAASTASNRPAGALEVTQTVDTRGLTSDRAANEIVLEIRATGRGVLPELDRLLTGLEGAADGFEIAENGVEVHPVNSLSQASADDSPFGFVMAGPVEDEDAEPLGPDADGVYRTDFERSWTVRYVPVGGARGDSFRLPALASGVEGSLTSNYFDDLDIVLASSNVVPIGGGGPTATTVGLIIAAGLVIIMAIVLLVRGRGSATGGSDFDELGPARGTPLAVIASLRRIDAEHGGRLGEGPRTELVAEIAALERRYFGPGDESGDGVASTDGLGQVVDRWIAAVRRG